MKAFEYSSGTNNEKFTILLKNTPFLYYQSHSTKQEHAFSMWSSESPETLWRENSE